jgi:hypothetical protein
MVDKKADAPQETALDALKKHALAPVQAAIKKYGFAPLIVALVVCIPLGMICDHRPVRKIDNAVFAPNPVHPGETANMIFTATDYRACTNHTSRWIVDSKGLRYLLSDHESLEYSDDVGKGPHTFVRDVPIPKGISIGTASFNAKVVRWCNPLQGIFWPMHDDLSVNFQVK